MSQRDIPRCRLSPPFIFLPYDQPPTLTKLWSDLRLRNVQERTGFGWLFKETVLQRGEPGGGEDLKLRLQVSRRETWCCVCFGDQKDAVQTCCTPVTSWLKENITNRSAGLLLKRGYQLSFLDNDAKNRFNPLCGCYLLQLQERVPLRKESYFNSSHFIIMEDWIWHH